MYLSHAIKLAMKTADNSDFDSIVC